ncbi:MAG: DUF4097 family beta strand repeat protein [Actinophytocola sp.]|uniref:DUF4097 family beta strand repeat-containing protein n=1 Tax=Actinophytocola sp. TaxID=1872138 RepID=UPI0013280CBA|nr:DUF4097 family beta strand repeat-containing protein [Actinophytocola sp.]MPZ79981.1 DUF4097 family beta strand repeat protein [Actinophytocola sp.]
MGIGRVVAATALGIAGLSVLSACGWTFGDETYSDSNGVGEEFTSVRFANDAGNITIRTGDTATVERNVHYNDEKPGEDTNRVRNGVLELDACPVRNCWIDYEVTVPDGTKISGQADSGNVELTGVAEANVLASSGNVIVKDVAGVVNVEASSGNIELSGIGGAVVAKAESGNVTANGVRGEVTLHASSGDIEARGIGGAAQVDSASGNVVVELTAARDVWVKAESGNVELTVPDAAYKVQLSSGGGHLDSQVEDDPAGAHQLDLHTDSGNITVTQA